MHSENDREVYQQSTTDHEIVMLFTMIDKSNEEFHIVLSAE